MSRRSSALALSLDADIERRLEALGADSDSRKEVLAREALLEALEDRLDVQAADTRMREGGRLWSLEALERGDDLAG